MTLVGNVNTFKLKKHQVLKWKSPSIKNWQLIILRIGQKGPCPMSDRVTGQIFWPSNLYKPGYASGESPAKRVFLYLLEDFGADQVSPVKNEKKNL